MPLLNNLPKLVVIRADGNSLRCDTDSLLAVQNYTKIHKIVYTNGCTENIALKKVHKFEKIVMGNGNDLESTTTRINRKNSWIFDEKDNNDTTVNKCPNQKKEDISEDDDDDEESLLMTIIKLSPWLVTTMIFVYGIFLGNCYTKKHTIF